MSTETSRDGLWGVLQERIGSPREQDGDIWTDVAALVDPAEYRPQLDDDIEIKRFERRSGEAYYMVANPRDLVHYRLEESDYQLLKLMDGQRTVKEIVVE